MSDTYPPTIHYVSNDHTLADIPVGMCSGTRARAHPEFIADLEYWLDDEPSPDPVDQLFIAFPYRPSRLMVVPDTAVPVGRIDIPGPVCRRMNIRTTPITCTLQVIAPSHQAQFERFSH